MHNDEETASGPENQPSPDQAAPNPPARKTARLVISVAAALIVLGGITWVAWHLGRGSAPKAATTSVSPSPTATPSVAASAQTLPGLQLNTAKNYGNKYADGVVPVGDGKYTTGGAKAGYVYACSQYAQNLAATGGGAMVRGPWFTNNNTEYNINQKIHVTGSVHWTGQFSNQVSGGTRTITSNNLPLSDPTGIFPILSSDPAYHYDRNPNRIIGQNFTYALTASPAYGSSPACESGTVGVMTTGVALFNALDAGGRDAGAWEIQDGCEGHPQSAGIYHYHTLSSCITDTSVHDVIGFALDGFPITGPKVGTNNILTTTDLDECHGLTSQINLDGKSVTMYHYVMTQDFPYSVSCFRGTPITPPGQAEGGKHQGPGPQ